MKLAMVLLLPILFLAISSAADILQNPDFELQPSNLPGNITAPIVLLNENNTIPGWTFEGMVRYVTGSLIVPLPGNGHAIELGQDGKINQTFKANGDLRQYLLTFTLARISQSCSTNASLIVSAPDSESIFSFKERYGKETWESYGHQLGNWGDGESISLVFKSQAVETDSNSTCWPIVDKLLLKTIVPVTQSSDNLLPNGGFELGPAFLDDSGEGILIDSEPSLVQASLQQWSVEGTVKYVDSKHFFVPEGKAAVEFVSGILAGIQTARVLNEGSSYNLEFMLGDANDACVGEFIVGVQAGSLAQNFTLQSNGTGSAKKFSLAFKAESSPTQIGFQSYSTSQSREGVSCGPMIDAVVLRASQSPKSYPQMARLISLLFLALC